MEVEILNLKKTKKILPIIVENEVRLAALDIAECIHLSKHVFFFILSVKLENFFFFFFF